VWVHAPPQEENGRWTIWLSFSSLLVVRNTITCNHNQNHNNTVDFSFFCFTVFKSASLLSPVLDLPHFSASSLFCFRRVGLSSPLFREVDRAALLADGESMAECGRRCWLMVNLWPSVDGADG